MTNICLVYGEWPVLKSMVKELSASREFKLAGTFTTAEEASDAVDWSEVDVLLVDVELPGGSGVQLIRRTIEINPVLLSVAFGASSSNTMDALQAGAYGFLLKDDCVQGLAEHVQTLIEGGSPIDPVVARRLVSTLWRDRVTMCREMLSHRRKRVLQLIAQGMSYDQVADELNLSRHTIHSHVKTNPFQVQGEEPPSGDCEGGAAWND